MSNGILKDADLRTLLGHEAAEDEQEDRLLAYFLKTSVYKALANRNEPFAILVGKKGTGKSALFRVAAAEDTARGELALRVLPQDLRTLPTPGTDQRSISQGWNDGLTQLIFYKALREFGAGETTEVGTVLRAGGRLIELLSRALGPNYKKFNLDPARKEIAVTFLETNKLTVYVDDLDEGWKGTTEDRERLAALITAARELMRDNPTLRFRIALRTDLYAVLRGDPSSDKYETQVIPLTWSNHDVFLLLLKRLAIYQGEKFDESKFASLTQAKLASRLDPILERTFHGSGKWANAPMYHVIMSFTRRRPRDLIKLLMFAGREAQEAGHSRIETADLDAILPEFCRERLQDVENEFRSELPQVRQVVLALKPNKVERTTQDAYALATNVLVKKLSQVIASTRPRFASDPRTEPTPLEILRFLYRIDVLQARLDHDDFIERVYYDENPNITPDQVDLGYKWEIHLAFRWVLQADQLRDIFSMVDPGAEAA
jgi:hypothetical protein